MCVCTYVSMGVVVGGGACLLEQVGQKKGRKQNTRAGHFFDTGQKKLRCARVRWNFRRPTLDPKSRTADPSRKPGDWWRTAVLGNRGCKGGLANGERFQQKPQFIVFPVIFACFSLIVLCFQYWSSLE